MAEPSYQLTIIDSLAETEAALADYSQGICGISQEAEKYTETRELIRRNRLDADFIAFQYEELMNMELSPGEHESLERERDILANPERCRNGSMPPSRRSARSLMML